LVAQQSRLNQGTSALSNYIAKPYDEAQNLAISSNKEIKTEAVEE
jgi:hypothetical protein